jgi:hypothetical protein
MGDLFVLALPDSADLLVCDEGGVWRLVHGSGGVSLVDEGRARVLALGGLLALYDRAHRVLESARDAQSEPMRLEGVGMARAYYESRAFVEGRLGGVCPPTLRPLDLGGWR